MSFNKILKFFVPQEKAFFPLFEEGSENLVQIAKLLKELLITADEVKRKEIAKSIKELEVVGDRITYTIYKTLNSTFITPFDREDIHDLASVIDDFADQINKTSQKITLYNLNTFNEDLVKMCDILVESANHINAATKEIRTMKNIELVEESCKQVGICENNADNLYHQAISSFFEKETNAIELIKKKEVLESIEKAADRANNIAKVIKTIQVKFS